MHESPSYRQRDSHSPIFVLCHAHAYSSVSLAVMGSHPELFWFPELRLFNAHTLGEALDTYGGPRDTFGEALDPGGELEDVPVGETERLRMSGAVRSVAQLFFGSQSQGDVDRAWGWVRENRDMSTAEFFDRLLEKVSPKVGIEKSPDTAASESHLMLCAESYPRARFVHLVRHPVTAVESLREKMISAYAVANMGSRSESELYRSASRIWFAVNQRIARFTAGLDPANVLRIRAEDLLNDTVPVARNFCEWAGLDSSDESINPMLHPERSPFAQPGPAHAPGGEHDKFLEDPTLRPAPLIVKVEIPERWGLNSNEKTGIYELAGELGYP
ncbi:MAG TPA: sulfotransferase [Acidimicrobiales bacterium]|nr:sulfotransferase [Acidimicrobiales bacterium]